MRDGRPEAPDTYRFSTAHPEQAYDGEARGHKARKAIAVFRDHLGDLSRYELLELGCSTGFMTRLFGEHFARVAGIDVDADAIDFATRNNSRDNISYTVGDAEHTGLADGSASAICCAQIYQAVPDAVALMNEVHRLLRVGGVCYFTAANRLTLFEPTYRIPLLSVVPRAVAHRFLRWSGRDSAYHTRYRTLYALRKLVRQFKVIDYTGTIIREPKEFAATELIRPGSFRRRLALLALSPLSYWLYPSYVWLLEKRMRA